MIRLLALSLLTLPAFAQQPPPSPPPPPLTSAPHENTHNRRVEGRVITFDRDSSSSTMGIVPPGTWWRNPETIKALNLSADQQKKMDDTFRQNRIALIDFKANLEKEQLNLEPIVNANPPDTNKALAQISRIADLRADLEKANAKMLLGLRSQLTTDQWTRLQSMHPGPTPYSFNMPEMRNMKSFNFKTGEARTDTTTTCTQKTGEGDAHKQCTTTTVTVKDAAGHPVVTTCVQSPGQSTPRCTTTPTGISDGSFNIAIPHDALPTPPPATFMLAIPHGDSE